MADPFRLGRRSGQDELARLQRRLDKLSAECERLERERDRAQDANATLARMEIGRGLAAAFLERKTPYRDDPALRALLEDGLLHHSAFIQKTPAMLQFYRHLFVSLERPPSAVLEIGVKGGGSTALWKALFPAATVVGVDIKLRRAVRETPSLDGVIYLQGDQTDVARLEEIAREHGPFGIVIDDGSHLTEHQAVTARALLRHVEPGGLYIIEDIHTGAKPDDSRHIEYGEDIWPDFVQAMFARLRHGPAPAETAGTRLADALAPMVVELIASGQVLALRRKADRAG